MAPRACYFKLWMPNPMWMCIENVISELKNIPNPTKSHWSLQSMSHGRCMWHWISTYLQCMVGMHVACLPCHTCMPVWPVWQGCVAILLLPNCLNSEPLKGPRSIGIIWNQFSKALVYIYKNIWFKSTPLSHKSTISIHSQTQDQVPCEIKLDQLSRRHISVTVHILYLL